MKLETKSEMKSETKYVVDTSVLIDGRISQLLEKGEIKGDIIIPGLVDNFAG